MTSPWLEFAADAVPYMLLVLAGAAILLWVLWKLQSAGRNQ
jgi:hypothetical protein